MFTALVTLAVLSAEPTHEITVAPTVEWSAKFTHHEGTQLRYDYHLAAGLSAFGAWREHWFTGITPFDVELISAVREEAQVATQLLLRRALIAGLSAEPFEGETSTGNRFAFRVSVGAGWGETQLDLSSLREQPFFADAGARLTGMGAIEFRYELNDRVVLSASLDDLVFPAYVESLNGCRSFGTRIDEPPFDFRPGRPTSWEQDSCRMDSFTWQQRLSAQAALDQGSTDIREIRSASLGVSVVF